MTSKIIPKALVTAFCFGTILNFVMAVFGMAVIFQADSVFSYITCIIGGMFFTALSLCMERIHAGIAKPETAKLYRLLRHAWQFSVALNMYAVANAIIVHVIEKQSLSAMTTTFAWRHVWDKTPLAVLIVSAALTLFLTASPMFLSYLYKEEAANAPRTSGKFTPPRGSMPAEA